MSAVALVAALLAGLLVAPLLDSAAQRATREPLARQAELLARIPPFVLASGRAQQSTRSGGVTLGVVSAEGVPQGPATALDETQLASLAAGRAVSAEGDYAGVPVYLEARPARSGGAVVLAADTADAAATTALLRRRVLLAIGIGLLAALITAVLVARRMSRPLVATAGAARRLAAGERGVPVSRGGAREIDDVAAALAALDTALTTSERRQRDFLLSVSHELRTPLTTLRGYSEALTDGLVAPEETAEVGRTMTAEADRLRRYVDDLLALARLEADDFTVRAALVDLTDLLRDTAAAWSTPAAAAGVVVSTTAAVGLVAETDAVRVRQVLDALIDNAVRVCGPGDRIVLGAEPRGDGVRLLVGDSGPGLTDDDARVAFEPGALHRRYAASRPVGHGLGLALVGRLVTHLGGTVRVDHAVDGALFVIDLPSQQRPTARAGRRAASDSSP